MLGFLLLFEALRIDGVLVSVYGAAAKGFWLTCMCVCVFTHVNTSYRFLHHPSSNIRQPEHMVQVGWSIGLS